MSPVNASGDVVPWCSVSFDDAFDAELASELGNLGPASEGSDDRGDRGGRRRHR